MYDDKRPGNVIWDKLCTDKDHGDLGFRNLAIWNQAAIGKLAWAIEKKKDNMWVKWVHALYIKDKRWQQYSPTLAVSWAVKYICKVKQLCTEKLLSTSWLNGAKYSIKRFIIL